MERWHYSSADTRAVARLTQRRSGTVGGSQHIWSEVTDYGYVAVKVPQDQKIFSAVGVGNGNGPNLTGPDQSSTHHSSGRVDLDSVQPPIDACSERLIGLVQPDQHVVGFRVHFQHNRHNTQLPHNGLVGMMAIMSKPVVVEVDSRRRVSLGKLGRHDRYLATEQPDGTITFEPAVILSEAEHAYLQNSELRQRIDDNRAHPERRRPRPSRPQAELQAQ